MTRKGGAVAAPPLCCFCSQWTGASIKLTFCKFPKDILFDVASPGGDKFEFDPLIQKACTNGLCEGNPAPWHPPAPAGGGKRFHATNRTERSRVNSSGRSRCSWKPPAPAGGGSTWKAKDLISEIIKTQRIFRPGAIGATFRYLTIMRPFKDKIR